MGRKKDLEAKTASGHRRRKNQQDESASDTDSVLNDNASVFSNVSGDDHQHQQQGNPNYSKNFESEDELEELDDFTVKLVTVLENLESVKSSKDRLRHYESLARALTNRYCEDHLENRKMTLQDIIEHGLKRSGDEAGAAAHILSLTLITLADGSRGYCEDLFQLVYPLLQRIFNDPSARPLVRSRCVTAMSLGCYITDYGLEKLEELIDQLLLLGFSTVRGHPDTQQLAEVNSLKANCLDMFSFLATVADSFFISKVVKDNLSKLLKCLESTHLELRVAAGECITMLYENELKEEHEYSVFPVHELRQRFATLATDSQKSKSKKELRLQRANFRQILSTIEGGDYAAETIRVGCEKVIIDSWEMKRYYDTLCSVLGSGMNVHLLHNPLVRNIFHLGPVILEQPAVSKASKLEAKHQINVAKKIREMTRAKQRGKRGDFDF